MKKILLTIILCLILTSFGNGRVHKEKHQHARKLVDTSFLNSKELNDSILYLALVHYDIKYPKIVLAQAKLETGNYTSHLCKNGNNLFGLYNSSKRSYHKFSHWNKSIQAYKSMIEYRLRDGEDYYSFLKRIKYASSSDYIKKLKEIEKDL